MIKPLLFRRKSSYSASEQDLTAAQNQLGVRFPAGLIEFCSRWNGGFLKEENSFYPVPAPFSEFHTEYGPKGTGIVADGLFGVTDDFPQCSLVEEYRHLRKVSAIGMIPIAYDLFGNYVVLQTDLVDGPVYWRDHELWEAPERPCLIPIATNLESFYNALTMNPYSVD